jgi:putative hydrolase of the HAD superfamily
MLSDAPLKAVLIDVGMPIIDERADYFLLKQHVRDTLRLDHGIIASEVEIEAAWVAAINSWAPSFAKAVLWHFLQPDRDAVTKAYRKIVDLFNSRPGELTLMDGVMDVIPFLAGKYKLAFAGNQPAVKRERLEQLGLLRYFVSMAVSEDIGFAKPDSRFFLEICRLIDVPPTECCMIGDRLDNDIYPANILGMRTIWVKVGPHAQQLPRMPEDVPDAIVTGMTELRSVFEAWESEKS